MTRKAVLSLLSVGLLAAAGGLLLWTLIPLLFGWSSSVVISGSMSPAVEAGDVVVTSPLPEDDVAVGYVIRFHDPNRPGRSILHRITQITENGRFVTKGDANRTADSIPIPAGSVTGMGRLRVPYVGLPMLWWLERDYPRLAVTALVVTVLCFLVPMGWSVKRRPRHLRQRNA
ncbi:signal peptidase I [Actinoplanes sp. CA-015351]|uniref:signal peptidase I n=1 Tax=Actinoplanes sp. CA-015351 TaxID=3239897 RepID=UPI003D985CD2